MDSWSRGGRQGGGQGRGRNDYYDNRQDYQQSYDNSNRGGGNVPISSRLGPNTSGHQDFRNSGNSNRRPDNRGQNNPNYRGRGGGNRSAFTHGVMEEDMSMHSNTGQIIVHVSGHPEGSEENLLGFLQRKAKIQLNIIHIDQSSYPLAITVANEESAEALCRLNTFTFGRSKLRIARASGRSTPVDMSKHNGRPPPGRKHNAITDFIYSRWDANMGYLNLDDIPQTKHSLTSVIEQFVKEAQSNFGDSVVTMSFARNRLRGTKPLAPVAECFPNLKNLSLEANEIKEVRDLSNFQGRFNQLEELILLGNPIQQNMETSAYQSGICGLFPSLKLLDGQPLSSLPPVVPSFVDKPESGNAADQLLSMYFPLFDSNRSALKDFYDPDAVFSFDLSHTLGTQNAWSLARQSQRLATNQQMVVDLLSKLPPTIHDSASFVKDAWQIRGTQRHPVVLFLTVHGTLREATGVNGACYAFDRMFLIAPQAREQLPMAILSDSLMIRLPS